MRQVNHVIIPLCSGTYLIRLPIRLGFSVRTVLTIKRCYKLCKITNWFTFVEMIQFIVIVVVHPSYNLCICPEVVEEFHNYLHA